MSSYASSTSSSPQYRPAVMRRMKENAKWAAANSSSVRTVHQDRWQHHRDQALWAKRKQRNAESSVDSLVSSLGKVSLASPSPRVPTQSFTRSPSISMYSDVDNITSMFTKLSTTGGPYDTRGPRPSAASYRTGHRHLDTKNNVVYVVRKDRRGRKSWRKDARHSGGQSKRTKLERELRRLNARAENVPVFEGRVLRRRK